jgi:hypothetical protein
MPGNTTDADRAGSFLCASIVMPRGVSPIAVSFAVAGRTPAEARW